MSPGLPRPMSSWAHAATLRARARARLGLAIVQTSAFVSGELLLEKRKNSRVQKYHPDPAGFLVQFFLLRRKKPNFNFAKHAWQHRMPAGRYRTWCRSAGRTNRWGWSGCCGSGSSAHGFAFLLRFCLCGNTSLRANTGFIAIGAGGRECRAGHEQQHE